MRRIPGCLLLASVLAACSTAARAGSHLWRFSEFYSSPDHSIQFIEMQEIGGSNNETAISNHWYQTNGYNLDRSELLGQNLPFGTANKKFLVGTASYAALEGVPEPDYVLPDGIIDPAGDLVIWWFYQTIEIPPGVMPSNGVHSISVDDPAAPTGYIVGTNSPTNFAGETGTVVLDETEVPALGAGGAIVLGLALLLVGSALLLGRRWRSHALGA